jgi:hypothetical protein
MGRAYLRRSFVQAPPLAVVIVQRELAVRYGP